MWRKEPPPTHAAPARHHRAAGGFDFTGAAKAVAADMVARLPELAHIDLDRVCFAFSQARNRALHGTYGSLTPLRFEGGALEGTKRGRRYRVQTLLDSSGREMLYILSLYLPRFMDLVFREKLITVLHELWHISPHCNGDIRRHPGRCYAHSHSREAFDEEVGEMVDRWLAAGPPPERYAFLQLNFAELLSRHGGIYGTKVPRPKLLPLK